MPLTVPLRLSPRWVQAGLLALAGLALASLYHRSCFIDDAWLGERAYWLAREGAVRSELFRGQLDYGDRMFVFHKLFALSGAAFIHLFGWSLYVLKSVSLVSFGAFLVLLWRYCRRFESAALFPIAALLMLAHGLVGLHIFVYRPEVMLMALGFGCFVLLRSFLEGGTARRLLGGAVVAGLCVLTHLNGVVFIAAGALLLLVRRRPGPAAAFALVASAVASLYLADAVLAGETATLWRQLRTDPVLAERFSDVGSRLATVLTEHERYFHSRAEIAFSVLFLVVVAATARLTSLRSSPLVPWTLGLVTALALLAPDKQAYYAIPLLPYLTLLTADGLVRGLPRIGRVHRESWWRWCGCLPSTGPSVSAGSSPRTRTPPLATGPSPTGSVTRGRPWWRLSRSSSMRSRGTRSEASPTTGSGPASAGIRFPRTSSSRTPGRTARGSW